MRLSRMIIVVSSGFLVDPCISLHAKNGMKRGGAGKNWLTDAARLFNNMKN
jgi:hypothetical protein